jgi:hypothetical protein
MIFKVFKSKMSLLNQKHKNNYVKKLTNFINIFSKHIKDSFKDKNMTTFKLANIYKLMIEILIFRCGSNYLRFDSLFRLMNNFSNDYFENSHFDLKDMKKIMVDAFFSCSSNFN